MTNIDETVYCIKECILAELEKSDTDWDKIKRMCDNAKVADNIRNTDNDLKKKT